MCLTLVRSAFIVCLSTLNRRGICVNSELYLTGPDSGGAERVGWPLRGAGCGCATARLEQGSKAHTVSAKIQKAPNGAFHILAERVGFEPTIGY